MATIFLTVSDVKYSGLEAAAKKDGITVVELVQKQLDYYTDVIIKDYVAAPVVLSDADKKELDILLAATKADFIRAKTELGPK